MTILPPRFASAIEYLRINADTPVRWRLGRGRCPLCGPSLFLAIAPNGFTTRCLRCTANVTNLALAPVIERHFSGRFDGRSAYELSTYGSTLKWLRQRFAAVTTSEYMAGKDPGSVVDGVLVQDVQRLTFPDESFDVVTSNQVFEHVSDDIQGFRECRRVLKPGGALVFSVPLYDTPATVCKAYLEGDDVKLIGPPEFHDSRLGGPGSAQVFWRHSWRDIADRVMQAGFARAKVLDVMIAPVQGVAERVVYAAR